MYADWAIFRIECYEIGADIELYTIYFAIVALHHFFLRKLNESVSYCGVVDSQIGVGMPHIEDIMVGMILQGCGKSKLIVDCA